uniref:Uncharacterized protein n=1 Tax=Ciona intestinalis TaxID=7719 RepID=H2XVP8_CIOIN
MFSTKVVASVTSYGSDDHPLNKTSLSPLISIPTAILAFFILP